MTENDERAGEVQDPAEPKQMDQSVETNDQPEPEGQVPQYVGAPGVQVAPGAAEVNVNQVESNEQPEQQAGEDDSDS